MRKTFILVALMGVGYASAASTIIYDTITNNSLTVSTSTPGYNMADGFNILPTSSSSLYWKVKTIEVYYSLAPGASISNLKGEITLFNTWEPSATDGVALKDQISTVTGTLGAKSNTGTGYTASRVTFTSNSTIYLSKYSNIGMVIKWTDNGTATNSIFTIINKNAATVTGGDPSSNVYYRDVDSDGVFNTSDARTLGSTVQNNIAYRITAEAVPEPATMGALAVGLSALFLRRRRK